MNRYKGYSRFFVDIKKEKRGMGNLFTLIRLILLKKNIFKGNAEFIKLANKFSVTNLGKNVPNYFRN